MAFLPDLVVALILEHAIAESEQEPRRAIAILAHCSAVSKQWHRLIARDDVEDERLWKALVMRVSPALPDNLCDLLFWEGERPSWRSAFKLYMGWSSAFAAPLSQHQLQPSVSEDLCDLDMPPVPASCYRLFNLATSVHSSPTPFLIEPRHAADLPQLQDALITFDYQCHDFTIVTDSGITGRAVCANMFDSIDGQCTTSGHCLRAMHIRKVSRSGLPMIFAASVYGLMYYIVQDDDDNDNDHDNDDKDDEQAEHDNDEDGHADTDKDGNDNISLNHEREGRAARNASDQENDCAHNTSDGNVGNGSPESEHVFVVHNVLANLTCDLWVVRDEPFSYTYWKGRLIFCPWSSPGYSSRIIKCVESGISGIECWSVELDLAPERIAVNAKYVAVLGGAYDIENFRMKLVLLDMNSGQVLYFFHLKFSIINSMLLTDTCLVLSISDMPVMVYRLPDLEPLYVLPLPTCDISVNSITLSPCGRFLGVASMFGGFVVYDMVEGCIKYSGTNGIGRPKDRKREVGDGVWLWYKDVEWTSHRLVAEKILYWQLRPPDLEYYKFLSSLA